MLLIQAALGPPFVCLPIGSGREALSKIKTFAPDHGSV